MRIVGESPQGFEFGNRAMDAISKVKFIPGSLNDESVFVKMKLPIFFKP